MATKLKNYPVRYHAKPGEVGADIGEINRNSVRQYFADHLGCSQLECSIALGLSVMSVSRHIRTIREEWRRR